MESVQILTIKNLKYLHYESGKSKELEELNSQIKA